MSRYAILSDIHSNLPALEAVEKDMTQQGLEGLWYLGDLWVYGPQPIQTAQEFQSTVEKDYKNNWTALLGNNDWGLLKKKGDEFLRERPASANGAITQAIEATSASIRWTEAQLADLWSGDSPIGELKWGQEQFKDSPQQPLRDVLLVHANPCDSIGQWGSYIHTAEDAEEALWRARSWPDVHLVFFGHTHHACVMEEIVSYAPYANVKVQPYTRQTEPATVKLQADRRYLINPGSVGQPRDKDPRAAYAIYDSESHTVTFRRVRYDLDRVRKAFTESELAREHQASLLRRLERGE